MPGSQQGPGAAHVIWAEGEGSSEVERVFAGSAKMDGESVVVFFRAMCAVSQEELEESGRVYMLQKLVECAHHNLGRIRLVWSRLWSALTPHITGASCHQDLKVTTNLRGGRGLGGGRKGLTGSMGWGGSGRGGKN